MSAEKLDQIEPETSAYKILCHLAFRGSVLKPQEIAEALKENGSTVRARLAELKKQGLVDARPEGYVAVVTPYDIIIKLYRDMERK
ncbi:MAG: DNA-binding protein [Candidatus Bathyarchaeia archaeon]